MPHPLSYLSRRVIPLCLAAATALLLAACQIGAPDAGPSDAVTPNAVAGDAIEVTALDDPALPPAEAAAADLPDSDPELAVDPAAEPAAAPDADPSADPGLAATEDAAAAEAEIAAPVEPKSPEALACEKKGGAWSSTGIGTLRTCVFTTRDGGKRCTRESDCDGVCLARSGTCSPLKPLMGCNDILQDNGARATICIE